MKKKRISLLILVLLCSFCVGFKWSDVELLDNDKLINLEKAIYEYAGFTEEIIEENVLQMPEEQEEIGKPSFFEIKIRDESIFLNNQFVNKPEYLVGKLQKAMDAEIVLIDNYAEAHTYKQVLNTLEENGFTLREDTSDE